MSAGRRGLFLSVAFLIPALWLCAGSVRAQPANDPRVGQHTTWGQSTITPERIREVLSRFGQDDGKNDWFEKMLFDAVKDKNPGADDTQVKETIKKLLGDKQFMDKVADIAQKQKNQQGPKNFGKGPDLKLTPEDIERLKRLRPDGVNADPLKVPQDPDKLSPFDPKHPQFDPKRFPAIDPENPPKFDPNTKFPLDERGRPFDPRDGERIDPKNPPKIDLPPPPKVDPNRPDPNPPKIDPLNPQGAPKLNPGDPKNPNAAPQNDKRRFDKDNPLGDPKDTPEKMAKTKAVETATALWEKNVGPIEESPAVQKAIIDLVSDNEAMEALTDSKGNNLFDFLRGENGNGEKLDDLFGKGDSNWDWPKLDFNWGGGRNLDLDFGNGSSRSRPDFSSSRSSRGWSGPSLGGGPSFNFGGMAVPFWFLIVLLVLITAAVLWWKWGSLMQPRAAVAFAGGPGEWPIDPRNINTREDVVKAFEYLSVLICGPAAKTWTHSTIAEELVALAATHGETAVKLARLYELARYAPLDEPLTRVELLEARRLVCDLAGMDE